VIVEMTPRSTLKEPPEPLEHLNNSWERLKNPWEPLNTLRCFTNLFRYSSAVNGYAPCKVCCAHRAIRRTLRC